VTQDRPEPQRTSETMTHDSRSDRTARLLTARLEELGRALERAQVPKEQASRLLESASIATMHAVTLDLLTTTRATELWREAAERHPEVQAFSYAAARRAA
jgi:hypothetical protein